MSSRLRGIGDLHRGAVEIDHCSTVRFVNFGEVPIQLGDEISNFVEIGFFKDGKVSPRLNRAVWH